MSTVAAAHGAPEQAMTDAQFAMFEQLAARPFLVLDTEYCADPSGDGHRLISMAITPVVRGRRGGRADGELYLVMNPGVAIDAKTSAIHGFTDADVARTRPFAHYAPALLRALSVPGAILVTHSSADVHVLRRELERLDEAAHAQGRLAPVGLSDLPNLPLVDTATLPVTVRYPGIGTRPRVSLQTLCELTGVRNAGAHHAREDARATAAALIRLLAHAARTFQHESIDALLARHDRGSTHAPPPFGYPTRPGRLGPSAAHLARHVSPLTHAASPDERAAWLDLAAECVRLRCPHLRAEAALAAQANAHDLLDPLFALLPRASAHGQPGTLLGAIAALIEGGAPHADPTPSKPVLTVQTAMRWWVKRKKDVAASPPCADAGRCPDCADGLGCPRDLLYQPITELAILAGKQSLTWDSVKDRLFGHQDDRRINRWLASHRREAAYMTWYAATWADEHHRNSEGMLKDALERNLEAEEPRLALLLCEYVTEVRGYAAALDIARRALAAATTDPAYDELRTWTIWRDAAAHRASMAAPRVITHPRLARPAGRVNPNPYLPPV